MLTAITMLNRYDEQSLLGVHYPVNANKISQDAGLAAIVMGRPIGILFVGMPLFAPVCDASGIP